MDSLPDGFLIFVALAALGSFVYGVAGFGSGLLAIPLALHFHTAHLVLPVFALVDCVNVVRVLSARTLALEDRSAVRQEVVRLVPACVVGLVVGSLLLTVIAPRPLMLLLGLFVLGYAAWSLAATGSPSRVSRRWAVPAGLGAGLTSSMFGIGGPPYAIYLVRRGLAPNALRAAMATTGLVSIFGRALTFGAAGLLADAAVWWSAALAVPASLAALAGADRVREHLSSAAIRRVIEWLLVLAGLSLVTRAVLVA